MTRPDRGWPRLKRVFKLPFTRARIDSELREEFHFHIQERVDQFVAMGMSRAEAEEEVSRRFGNYEAYRQLAKRIDEETMRQRTVSETIETLRREIRFAARVLVRTPAFSLIAFVTLALGIGATTAIFTVLDAVVLRPLPYPDASELVSVLHPATVPGNGERKWGLSPGGYFYFRNNNKSFSDLGIYQTSELTVVGGDRAEVVRVGIVTPSVFSVLTAHPHLGRLVGDQDAKPDSIRRVVLSYEFWQRRFGRDGAIVGKTLQTGEGSYEIIGVTEPGLTLPMPGPFASTANLAGFGVDVWIALKLNPNGPFYNNHPNVGLARLKPGVTVADANREIVAMTRQLPVVVPTAYLAGFMKQYNFRGEVSPLKDSVLGPMIPKALWALFGAVILVLLIAVANVANLFIVRMDSRRRESTIRTALGADRLHMAVHYLSESMLLCGSAAIAGVTIAVMGLRALLAIAPKSVPRLAAVTLSWQSIAFAVALALVIGAVFGIMPLLRRNTDMATLREGGRGLSVSRAQRTFRSGLVVAQMAFALVLLASAGLMIRTFMNLRDVKPGLDPSNVLAFDVGLPFGEYDTYEKAGAFHRELQRRIAALPGVTSIGGVSDVPLDGGYGTGCSAVFRENRPYGKDEQTPCVSTPTAAPGFFEALRIPVRGRTPTWVDVDARTQAVVITKALGDRLWPGEDPLGKGIATNGPNSTLWYRIVGVIPELRAEALDQPPTEAVFYAASGLVANRRDGSLNDLTYLVRTKTMNPTTLIPTMRRLLAEMNPRVPFVDGRSMEAVVSHSMQRTSFIMILLGISASVALLLSAVGIYGVISYVVTQRQFEIGVRIALGARVTEVARLVMMQSMRLAVLGILLGLIGTYAVTSVIRSLLFNVSPMDPLVLGTVALMLLVIAGLASFAPARRAARIDPVEALRAE
jgi:putative ABC transport system permease protein